MHSVQSRLKSRKLLGVGEGADGLQPRSKITQLLGTDSMVNEQLSSYDYPIILTVLQYSTSLWISGIALISLLFPKLLLPEDLRDIENSPSQHSHLINRFNTYTITAVRLYGAALLAITCLLGVVTFLHWSNRSAIRIALLVKVVYFSCELIVAGITQMSGIGNEWRTGNTLIISVVKVAVIVLSVYYYRQIRANNNPLKRTAPE